MSAPDLTEAEQKTLAALASVAPDMGLYFRGVTMRTGLETKDVRKACRSLRAKGLAYYTHMCDADTGAPCGAGYFASDTGEELAKTLDVELREVGE